MAVVDRHDDELAERRMSAARPQPDVGSPGGSPEVTGPVGAALPLEWDESGDDAEAESESGGADTIDLTERAGRDDLAAWSDVLRRRPAEAARITGHPSAAGEYLAGRRRPDDDDDFARALLDRRRRRGSRSRPGGEGRESSEAAEE
ncbi:MAG: hypothetical protein M3357_09745, partial [Actinomycetota bacterium]|nr:hypothetical protein [Actinomycetota bacterium]